jgi:hypothetical protein
LHFYLEDNDDSHAEYYPYDGTISIWLGGHLTIWDLIGTIIHEQLHRVIEENCPEVTTEKQDHYIIQRLCF